MDRYTTQKRIVPEGAHFENQERFNSRCNMIKATESNLTSCGVPMDCPEDGIYATSADEHHVLIVGDTGCGKTRRLIVPAIRLLSKTGQSMVVSDPKGELYQKTAKGLKQRGYDVKVLNFRNPRRGERWNPFTVIEELYKSNVPEKRDKALLMLQDILNIMKKNVHSDRDLFWENASEQYINAIILTIMEYGDVGSLDFTTLSTAENEISSWVIEHCKASSPIPDDFEEKGHFKELDSFINSLPPNSPIRMNFNSLLSIADDVRPVESISVTAHTMANTFSKQSTLQYLLSGSDFDIKDLGRKRTAIFIVLPDDSEAMYPLATMFVNQVYSQMIDLAYENGGKLPNPVNFVLDEFANFSRLPNFRSMLTASRSRCMRFFLVVQDVDQLESQYGETDAAIIRSNCHDWVFMGCRNLEFLEMLVELSGIRYDRYTGSGRQLLSISDLLTLQTGETVVWIRGCNPKRCWLPDYSEVDFGSEDISELDFPPQTEKSQKSPVSFLEIIKEADRQKTFLKEDSPANEEDIKSPADPYGYFSKVLDDIWETFEDDDENEEEEDQ